MQQENESCFINLFKSDDDIFDIIHDIREEPTIENVTTIISAYVLVGLTVEMEESNHNSETVNEQYVAILFDSIVGAIVSKNPLNNDILTTIAKAGTYIRYGAMDLIRVARNSCNKDFEYDLSTLINDIINRKIDEDTIKPEDEAEVERIINETEEIIDEAEKEAKEINPFYSSEEEDILESENDKEEEFEGE